MSLETDLAVALAETFPPLARYVPPDLFEQISAPQAAFLLSTDRELLYGGSAGGGKSAALLMGGLQYVDVPGYRAAILRRTFAQLTKGDALIPLSHEWLQGSDAKWNEQKKTWTFPSGATLEFGHCQNETDKYDYQGAAFHYVGFDEVTQFTESIYTYIAFSRQRRRTKFVELGIPVRVRGASNPGGIGHSWVAKRFLGGKTHHRVYRAAEDRLFVPAKVRDNPGLDADDYEASLGHLNEMLRRQLMDGDWGAFEGMAYQLDPLVHFVEPVHENPGFAHWDRWESMDHGVRTTAWLAYASDNDGNVVVFDEYYGQQDLPDRHADEVKERRREFWERKDEDGWPQRHACYGDPASIAERTHERNDFGDPMTIQDIYQRHGVRIIPANNRRQVGYVQVCDFLKPDPKRLFPLWHPRGGESGSPKLFIVEERCPELVEQLQTAPLASGENDPLRGEAVDGKWESDHGHAHASCRYGLTTRFRASKEPPTEPADPRAAYMAKRLERTRRPRSRFIDV